MRNLLLALTATGLTFGSVSTSFTAGSAPQPTICERACWGARAPKGAISQESTLNRAIIHHTANQGDYNTASLADSQANVRATQNYHMDVNGWSDIGYHFLTDKLGNNFEGRQGSMTSLPRGAHDGANTASFGFNIMGYYHTPYNNQPTEAGMDALAAVIAWRMPTGWAGPYGYPNCSYGSLGHCVGYVDSHRRVKATACPGDLIHGPYVGDNPAVGTFRDMVQAKLSGGPCTKSIPLVPSSVAASAASATQVNLSWADNAADEDGSNIYRSTTAGGPYTKVGAATANATAFTDNTAAHSTTYFYVVRAYNCAGESANSNEASATTPVSFDIIVDNPAATVVGSWSSGTSAADKYGSDYRYKAGAAGGPNYLQFTPNVPAAAEYNVYEWHSQGTNRSSAAQIAITHSAGTSTVGINQQANGGKWNLLGKYVFSAGTSGNARITDGHSDTAQVVIADAIKFEKLGDPPPPPLTPAAPSNLAGTAVSRTQVNLTWVDNADNETNLVVEYKKANVATWGVYASLGANATSISVTGLTRNTSYNFRVKAINADGSSPYSNTATVKTLK